METDMRIRPVATVTGLYRGRSGGLEPLLVNTPLSHDEVRRNPIFYELDLNPERDDENLIIDVIYDNLSPIKVAGLTKGNGYPAGSQVLAGLVRYPTL